MSEGATGGEKYKKARKPPMTKARAARQPNRALFGGGCCTGDPRTVMCSGCGYRREEKRRVMVLPSPRCYRDKDWLKREFAKMSLAQKQGYQDWLHILKPLEKHPLQAANLAMELQATCEHIVTTGDRKWELPQFYAACEKAAKAVSAGKLPPIW